MKLSDSTEKIIALFDEYDDDEIFGDNYLRDDFGEDEIGIALSEIIRQYVIP